MSLLNNSKILKNPAFRQPFVVKRPAAGAFDGNGIWQAGGGPAEIEASGSIQPVNSSDMNYLREASQGGMLIKDAIRIYSNFEFKPGTLGTNSAEGDSIVYNNLTWGVIRVNSFSKHGHDKVFGVRFDGQDG